MCSVEAAIQRLTSVCATIGRLEPVQVVNEVFFPKEYLRERVANLFRARLLNVIIVEGELQRPTVVEAELRRLMGITNLVEMHSGLDIARSLREVLLSEAYETPLQERALTDPPRPKSAWKTIDVIADWYLENIVRDTKGTGVVYAPLDCGFRSTQTGVSHPAELVADRTEIEALVRIFGPYGSDKIESILKEHIKEMIMRLEVTVRMNKEAFENVVKNMHLATERNKCRSRAEDIEVAMTACVQIGHCLALRELLSKATAKALKENVPLLFSSIESLTAGIPEHASEPGGTLKLRRIAGLVGAASKADDSLIIVEILNDLATAGESYWLLLPILYAMMMMAPSWRHSHFNTSTGGFNDNANCLARCIHATIAGVERAGEERSELQRQAIREMPVQGPFRPPPAAPPAPVALGTRIHGAMRQLIACASVMILGSAWDEENRGPAFIIRVLFMDHLVETSSYPIRSILEEHIPYSILRPILRNEYDISRHEDGPPSDHSHQRKGSLSRTITAPFSNTSSGTGGRLRTFSSGKPSDSEMMSADESNATSGRVRRSSTLRQMFSSASRRSSYESIISSGGGERAVDSTADSSEVQTSVRRRSLSVVMASCRAPRSPPSDDEDEPFSEPIILDSNQLTL